MPSPKPPSCLDCPAHSSGIGWVPSRGPSHVSIGLIGQGPGEEEVRRSLPFVGPSGRLLSYWIRLAGLLEEALHIDNIVRCRLVATDLSGTPVLSPSGALLNRPPTAAEVAFCWPRHGLPALRSALRAAPHPVAVACGVPAMTALLPFRGRASLAGNVFEIDLPEDPPNVAIP